MTDLRVQRVVESKTVLCSDAALVCCSVPRRKMLSDVVRDFLSIIFAIVSHKGAMDINVRA